MLVYYNIMQALYCLRHIATSQPALADIMVCNSHASSATIISVINQIPKLYIGRWGGGGY